MSSNQNNSADNTQYFSSFPAASHRAGAGSQTIIQIEAQLPPFMDGNTFDHGFVANGNGANRTMGLFDITIGTTQEAIENDVVSVKGRFRVQERNIGNGFGINASHEDPLHFSSDQQNLVAVANEDEQQDHNPNDEDNQKHDRKEQHDYQEHSPSNHEYGSSPIHFEVIQPQRLSYQPPSLNVIGGIDSPRSSGNQKNISGGYGGGHGLVIGKSGGANGELLLSSQKSKSYSGYFKIREKLNESSESNHSSRLIIDHRKDTSSRDQSHNSKDRLASTTFNIHTKKALQDSYRKRRIESDDNLADKEDNNLENRGQLSKQSKATPSSNRSQDGNNSMIHQDNQLQNLLENTDQNIEAQQQSNDNQMLGMRTLNRVQEDHENEADESSACGEDHTHGINHGLNGPLNKSKSFEQGNDTNSNKLNANKDDSYFYQNQDQQPFQQQTRLLNNAKDNDISDHQQNQQQVVYQSELRSDKSEVDHDSPNDEYQSISSLQNKLNRNQKFKAKDVTSKNKRETEKNLFYEQKNRPSNESKKNGMTSKYEQKSRKENPNNSQDYIKQRYDWVRAEQTNSNEDDKQGVQTQKIHMVLRSTKTNKQYPPSAQNYIEQDNNDSKNEDEQEEEQQDQQSENMNRVKVLQQYPQAMKVRLDSETNDFNNGTIGQSSNNINENDDNSQNTNMDQIHFLQKSKDDSLILVVDKSKKVSQDSQADQNSGNLQHTFSSQINVAPLDQEALSYLTKKYILIIDKTGKRTKFSKNDLNIIQQKQNILIRLPSGQRILAKMPEQKSFKQIPPSTQVLVTSEKIKQLDESQDEEDSNNDDFSHRVAKRRFKSNKSITTKSQQIRGSVNPLDAASQKQNDTQTQKMDHLTYNKIDECMQKGRFLIKNSIEDKQITTEKQKRKSKNRQGNKGSDSQNSRKHRLMSQFHNAVVLDNEVSNSRSFQGLQQSMTGDQSYNHKQNPSYFIQQQMLPQQMLLNQQYLSPHPQQFPSQMFSNVGQSPLPNRRGTIFDQMGISNARSMFNAQRVNSFDSEEDQEVINQAYQKQKSTKSIRKQLQEDQTSHEEIKVPDSANSQKQEHKSKHKTTKAKNDQSFERSKKLKKNKDKNYPLGSSPPYATIPDYLHSSLNQTPYFQGTTSYFQNTLLPTAQSPPTHLQPYYQNQQQQQPIYPPQYQQQMGCQSMGYQGACPLGFQQQQNQYAQYMNQQLVSLCREQTQMFGQIANNMQQMMSQVLNFQTEKNRKQQEQRESSSSSEDSSDSQIVERRNTTLHSETSEDHQYPTAAENSNHVLAKKKDSSISEELKTTSSRSSKKHFSSKEVTSAQPNNRLSEDKLRQRDYEKSVSSQSQRKENHEDSFFEQKKKVPTQKAQQEKGLGNPSKIRELERQVSALTKQAQSLKKGNNYKQGKQLEDKNQY